MKKLFFAFVSIGLCCFFAGPALATSGACSSHGGVDCAAGADYDGSVICYDGWTGSSVAYANMVECGGSSQGGADYSFDNSSGSGACSSHGGVDCNQLDLVNDKVVCADGWKGSSVSYTEVCTPNLQSLTLHLALLSCKDFLLDVSAAQDAAGVCVQQKREDLLKQFDSSCTEAVETELQSGEPLCISYSDYCSTDTLRAQTTYCRSRSTNTITSSPAADISQAYVPIASAYDPLKKDSKLIAHFLGQILLEVQDHGEAWYVNPKDSSRYYMRDGATAYSMMRSFGSGIANSDLEKIPSVSTSDEMKASTSICSANALANRVKGQILLQVQERGEAWYVDPSKCRRIYMKDGDAAYQIMRYLGQGIADSDLQKIPSK